MHTYANPYAFTGFVAYGSWLLVLGRNASSNWAKSILAFACSIALLSIAVYPLVNPYVRVVDILGSALFAAGYIAFGLFLADRFGFDLLAVKAE